MYRLDVRQTSGFTWCIFGNQLLCIIMLDVIPTNRLHLVHLWESVVQAGQVYFSREESVVYMLDVIQTSGFYDLWESVVVYS